MPETVSRLNQCWRCETAVTAENRYKVRYRQDDGTYILVRYCADCTRNYTSQCNECSNRFPDDQVDDSLIYVSDRGGRAVYCRYDDCYEGHVWFCDGDMCGNANLSSRVYCNNCGRDPQGNRPYCSCRTTESIHQYNCVPNELIFHGSSERGLFMGIELETQISNSNVVSASNYARDRLQGDNIAILKNDGSIGGGFEIVTHPRTYESYLEADTLWHTIQTLREDYGARSWDSGTCGLHIHISRKGFTDAGHTHRFIEFIYRNSEYMMKYGGRKSDYARFNDVWGFDEYDKPIFTLEGKGDDLHGGDKYTAVNTGKRDTLELRFIRGTTNTDSIKASIGFAHAMVMYTETLNPAMSDWWDWSTFVSWINDRADTYPYLVERIANVPALVLSELSALKVNA